MTIKKIGIIAVIMLMVCIHECTTAMDIECGAAAQPNKLTINELTPESVSWENEPFTRTGLCRANAPTPLFEAIILGRFDLAQTLIGRADWQGLSRKNNSGLVPFYYLLGLRRQETREIEKAEIAELYFKKADDNLYDLLYSKDNNGSTLWKSILCDGNQEIIKTAVNLAKKMDEKKWVNVSSFEWTLLTNLKDSSIPMLSGSPLALTSTQNKAKTVALLLELAGKHASGLIEKASYFRGSLLQAVFIEDHLEVRNILMVHASEKYLQNYFKDILSQFHEIQRKNVHNPGCLSVSGWMVPALLELHANYTDLCQLSEADQRVLVKEVARSNGDDITDFLNELK